MTRLIDADKLKFVSALIEPVLIGDEPHWEIIILKDRIDNAPTVEAVRVVHGKWIIRDNPGTGWYRVTCSECGEDVTATAPCIGFFPNAKVSWDYCPNCGSRNRSEE